MVAGDYEGDTPVDLYEQRVHTLDLSSGTVRVYAEVIERGTDPLGRWGESFFIMDHIGYVDQHFVGTLEDAKAKAVSSLNKYMDQCRGVIEGYRRLVGDQ